VNRSTLLAFCTLGMPWGVLAQTPPARPRAATPPRTTVTMPKAPAPAVAPRAPIIDPDDWHDLFSEAWAGVNIDTHAMRADVEREWALQRSEFERQWADQRVEWEAQWNRAREEWDHARLEWPALAPLALDHALTPLALDHGLATTAPEPAVNLSGLALTPRAPWARGDQGDSVYRRARDLLNSGEYRRAAAAFRDIIQKTPNSTYAADALYWQAFALYRIGGNSELREALGALDQQKSKYPGARLQNETEALSVRIRGALAARGDASYAAQLRTAAAESLLRCDREEQAVRAEALNALAQSDPEGALPLLQKTLARRDTCSAPLRRNAIFLLGSKRGQGSAALLAQTARTDPSIEVRGAAIEWLARFPGEESLGVLEELARDTSERVQRTAVRALVLHSAPRARQLVRGIVERSETPERLRLEALAAFDRERSTSEDVTWMRALYARTENPKIKARLVSTLSSIGGPEVDQWLLSLARDTEVDSDTRRSALRRVGRTLPVADIGKLYDASAERSVREMLIEILGSRAEGEATDKLLEIVKSGTDPQLRSRAINAVTSKRDPRALRLLMEIIDK
jgi:HEAT repeat protein